MEADVKIGYANHVENHVENPEDVNHVEKRNVRVKEGVEEGANKCRRHITMGLAPSCSTPWGRRLVMGGNGGVIGCVMEERVTWYNLALPGVIEA